MQDKYVIGFLLISIILLIINTYEFEYAKTLNALFVILFSGVVIYRIIKYKKYQNVLQQLNENEKSAFQDMNSDENDINIKEQWEPEYETLQQ